MESKGDSLRKKRSPRAHHNLTAGDNTKIIHDDPDEERHRWPVPPESAAENEVASTWP